MKILLDTSVFMSVFTNDAHCEDAKMILEGSITEHDGYFCSMTINEIIWVLKRHGYPGNFITEKVEMLFALPLDFLAADKEIFTKAIDVMGEYHLLYGDAQIAAQAIVNRIDNIGSFDSEFDKVKAIRRFTGSQKNK